MMQLMYGSKTENSLQKFLDSFSLSTNEKQFSKIQESLKFIEEIIVPYFEKEGDMLNLRENFPTLLIIDVFPGQMTDPVIKMLK